jgi:hypothetical protein
MSLRRLAIVLVLENKEGARFAAWPVCAVGREVLGAASGERRGAREQRREVIGAWCVQAARRPHQRVEYTKGCTTSMCGDRGRGGVVYVCEGC